MVSFEVKMLLRAVITAIIAGTFLYGTAFPLSVPDEVARIQSAYEGMKDMKGSFTQKTFIKDLKKTETYSGTFFIKRPSKMRWKYAEQEILIRGDEVLVYQKKEKQAFKSHFDKSVFGRTPVALLGGLADIQKEFDISEKDGRLLLRPAVPMGGVKTIEITPSKVGFPIAAFRITDSYSNTTEITLSDVEVNSGVGDRAFELSLPKGVTVHEHNP